MIAAAKWINAKWVAPSFSYRIVNLRNRLNQEWQASTTHRRALKEGFSSFSRCSSPRGRTCGLYPATSITLQGASPAYPASAHRFSDSASMIGSAILFAKTAFSWLTSCRLAPVTTTDNGTPRPSTRIWRFVPFFSSIRRISPGILLGHRSLVHAAIYGLPFPGDTFHVVILGQASLPKLQKETRLFPFSEIPVNCARTTKNFFG